MDLQEDQTQEAVSSEEPTSTEELINKAVEERLSKLKGNLDGAYGQRDAAMKELETLKKEKQELEIKSLEDSGKATEALQARLDLMQEEHKALMEANTKLSRDSEVKAMLAGMDFTHEKAAKMASQELVGSMKRSDNGDWVGPNGEPMSDYIAAYAQDESNSFLFKAKVSQGSSSAPSGTVASSAANSQKSISQMSVEEAIAAAAKGNFDNGKTFY